MATTLGAAQHAQVWHKLPWAVLGNSSALKKLLQHTPVEAYALSESSLTARE
ncbi:MAG: hypothetical protein AAFR58_11280 [Cyanobacteria bacterium J06627_28]